MKTTTNKAIAPVEGWDNIIAYLRKKTLCKTVIAVECAMGADCDELTKEFEKLDPILFINTRELFVSPESPDISAAKSITNYFDFEKLQLARTAIDNADDNVIVLGCGAHLVSDEDILIYVDSASAAENKIFDDHKKHFFPYVNYLIESDGAGGYKMTKQ
ncbi:hypothetical protein [Dysgonomonas sp. 25]|uniref:hypothetical protein n=1 Tax=Dysgonomonas sp. 25 TaxID=2302933 RepID=UPI0013D19B49|nr:hypothetical protein [Dysgonomonas sp. 25]NDV70221.1 hypothetical protein [Dysgonomonas sp. 25]